MTTLNFHRFLVLKVVILAVGHSLLPFTIAAEEWKGVVNDISQSELFEPSDQIRAFSPTHFPKPTDKIGHNVTIVVEPTFGTHRPEQDVIFAYAEGYSLPWYMQFMGTLAETGYSGDVVLAIAEHRIISDDVEDYLRTFVNDANKPNIVVYQHVLSCDNLDEPGKRKVNKRSKETDTFQMCNLPRVYGWKDAMTGKILNTAHDPRRGRVVATIRYEWYWIWSQQYDSHSWIMLLDSRDSFFQSNPFVDLPRQNNASQRKDGLLYFFGENSDATRLGKSNKNAKWLLRGYGPEVLKALENKPTICSGSTMGEQVALETYLRALVQEHDESVIKMTGSDQGFHNYLYYSNKLRNAATIRRLVVWEQGRGIINNVGAMRTKPLEEWGIYNPETHEVFQWDGKTLSPVVHQWDRDAHLHNHIVRQKHKKLKIEWERQKVAK